MTVTGKDKIEIIEKDPEGEEGRIKVNLSFLQMCHYLQIVELIVELGPEEQEDWTFGSLVYEEEKYSIGIPTVLYKELLPIAEGKEENLLEKLLEKISSKETYLLDIVPDEALLWKLTWGICIAGIAIAIISFFFLPEIIPVHFAGNGVADDFGNKIEIFLMPILLLTVTILSGIKSIKYVLMHSKTWLTVGQYNLMIDCVLGIILIAEIFMIYASFV